MVKITNNNRLCRALVGSHLYGLNTDKSDEDYKGVYLPSWPDCILQKIGHSISVPNAHKDPEQYFSLHQFIRLLSKGEVVCFDLLHARPPYLKQSSAIWGELYDNRRKFYSKKFDGFLGFVLSQTRKYSARGARYNAVRDVIEFLQKTPHNSESRLKSLWNKLPEGPFSYYSTDIKGQPVYSVCGRMAHPSVKIDYAIQMFETYKSMYGHRAISAAESGYDLKAISHAFRCLEELRQILDEGDLTFPVRNTEKILAIKTGQTPISDGIFERMEEEVAELQGRLQNSNLPDQVDTGYWDSFILSLYGQRQCKPLYGKG